MEEDIRSIEIRIREHEEAIDGLRNRLESLMRAKLDVLIKSSKDGRVETYPNTFLCYNKGRLCMFRQWGKGREGGYSTIRNLVRVLENECPASLYYKIREVDLNAKN